MDKIGKEKFPYRFGLETDGRTYTITATHKKRPDTRRRLKIGPDGKIVEIQK